MIFDFAAPCVRKDAGAVPRGGGKLRWTHQ